MQVAAVVTAEETDTNGDHETIRGSGVGRTLLCDGATKSTHGALKGRAFTKQHTNAIRR